MSSMQTRSQFHEETASNLYKFFELFNIPPSAVENSYFRNLCLHLNPLAQLPTSSQVESVVKTERSPDPMPCIICGYDLSNKKPTELYLIDALMYLTTAVLTDKIQLSEAKRNILTEHLVICSEHVVPLYVAMVQLPGYSNLGGSNFRSLVTAQDDRFESGLIVFNKLRMMWYTYFEKKNYKNKSEIDYRGLVQKWISSTAQHKSRTHRVYWENVLNTFKPIENSFAEQTLPDAEAEESANDEVLKDVKLEEPEYREVKTEAPTFDIRQEEYSPPTIQDPTSSDASSSFVPTVMISKNQTIYTLKNGKKVVKRPSGFPPVIAITGNAAKLVTYRLATRKVIRKAPEVTNEQCKRWKNNL
uniref:CID domain-containing protein n=2 Tax=Caenorhabditis tropicalis TaxID=1561998 RepID=A0A1I7UG76_9PELO